IEELEAKNAKLTQENEALKQQASVSEDSNKLVTAQLEELQQANCKGVWTPGIGCEEPKQVFTFPVGDETLCFGKTAEVKWDASLVKAESVDVYLATSRASEKLATLQNSEGVYRWKLEPTHKVVGESGGFTIAQGLYRLRLQTPDGILLGKDTELFSIKKCGGKAAAAPKKAPLPSKKAKPAARKKR
ncbi:MAG: hypothetical protein AAB250_03000, partial [Bdellovibrionota bacterium]